MAGQRLLIAGVIVSYVEFGASTGTGVMIGVAAAMGAGTFAWLKYFPESRMARPFVSQGTVGDLGTERPELVGQTGTVQIEISRILRVWKGTNPDSLPRSISLRNSTEDVTNIQLDAYGITAGANAPKLQISFVRQFRFGVP